MSQRESLVNSISLTEIGGVNERRTATELPPAEYSSILGVYPEYVNQQTRIPGKRLLHKYALPIWGIFQFWTPLGYANGLYQFESELDSGPWLTPVSNIVIPPLDTDLPIDGDGNTVNDFGLSAGGPITPPPGNLENVGTPDDSNGSPAGQGKQCQWVDEIEIANIEDLLTFARYGDTGVVDNTFFIPGPTVVPLPPVPAVSTYTDYPVGPFARYLYADNEANSYWVLDVFIPAYIAHQTTRAINGKVTFSFATLQTDSSITGVSLIIHQRLIIPLPLVELVVEVPLSYTRNAEGNIPDQIINMQDYMNYSQAPQANSDGFSKRSDVFVAELHIHRSRRICA